MRTFHNFIIAVFIVFLLCALLTKNLIYAQDSSFTFGAAGDFGSAKKFQATAEAVKKTDPDFMIALGDLSYSSSG
jgi:hypothetical protein